jgi:transposase
MLTSGVVLICYNARPHAAARTLVVLEHFNWELFVQPPYSSDLAPSNSFTRTNLKNRLKSQRFRNND